jgi:hypothetical protein
MTDLGPGADGLVLIAISHEQTSLIEMFQAGQQKVSFRQ